MHHLISYTLMIWLESIEHAYVRGVFDFFLLKEVNQRPGLNPHWGYYCVTGILFHVVKSLMPILVLLFVKTPSVNGCDWHIIIIAIVWANMESYQVQAKLFMGFKVMVKFFQMCNKLFHCWILHVDMFYRGRWTVFTINLLIRSISWRRLHSSVHTSLIGFMYNTHSVL